MDVEVEVELEVQVEVEIEVSIEGVVFRSYQDGKHLEMAPRSSV